MDTRPRKLSLDSNTNGTNDTGTSASDLSLASKRKSSDPVTLGATAAAIAANEKEQTAQAQVKGDEGKPRIKLWRTSGDTAVQQRIS